METITKLSDKEVVQNFLTLQYEGKVEEAFENYVDSGFKWLVSTNNKPELIRSE